MHNSICRLLILLIITTVATQTVATEIPLSGENDTPLGVSDNMKWLFYATSTKLFAYGSTESLESKNKKSFRTILVYNLYRNFKKPTMFSVSPSRKKLFFDGIVFANDVPIEKTQGNFTRILDLGSQVGVSVIWSPDETLIVLAQLGGPNWFENQFKIVDLIEKREVDQITGTFLEFAGSQTVKYITGSREIAGDQRVTKLQYQQKTIGSAPKVIRTETTTETKFIFPSQHEFAGREEWIGGSLQVGPVYGEQIQLLNDAWYSFYGQKLVSCPITYKLGCMDTVESTIYGSGVLVPSEKVHFGHVREILFDQPGTKEIIGIYPTQRKVLLLKEMEEEKDIGMSKPITTKRTGVFIEDF